MPKMFISKSIVIDQPVDKVFAILNDFNQWQVWSPWLIMEPGVQVTVSNDARHYAWVGNRVGEGNMTITNGQENKSLDIDLQFLKPWKSTATVRFELTGKGDSTEVTWFMDSSLPFFLFWMKKLTEAMIGMDYERGLMMLKDYAEHGSVPSKLDFTGTSKFDGCKYIGVRSTCSKATLGQKMQDDFKLLWDFLADQSDLVAGNGLSIYHKWDMVNDQIEYTSAVQVTAIPDNLPARVFAGEIPSTPVHVVKHTGPYRHLGNVWSTQHNMMRGKAFKQNKKLHPFEVYGNIPGQVEEKELVTEVMFATR